MPERPPYSLEYRREAVALLKNSDRSIDYRHARRAQTLSWRVRNEASLPPVTPRASSPLAAILYPQGRARGG